MRGITVFNTTVDFRMKNFTVSAILALVSMLAVAQTSYDFSNSNRTDIITDDFSDKRNNWPEVKEVDRVFRYMPGYYLIHSKDNYSKIVSKRISINPSRDFEIEAELRIIRTPETSNGHSLRWGGKDGKCYLFGFTQEKRFFIIERKQGSSAGSGNFSHKEPTYSSIIKPGGYNKLTVRKVEGTYYFLINEQFVHKMSFTGFHGNEIGFENFASSMLSVNHFRVSYLGSRNDNQSTMASRSGSSTKQEVIFNEQFNDNANWSVSNVAGETAQGISAGYFNFEYLREEGQRTEFVTVDMPSDKNFEIESSIKKVAGSVQGDFGIQWGFKDANNHYGFYLNGNGLYRIRKRENGNWSDMVGQTLAFTNKGYGSTNKLSVRRVGNELEFFINDHYVDKAPFQSPYGNGIGISIEGKQKIAVDYFKISYIDQASSSAIGSTSNSINNRVSSSITTINEKRVALVFGNSNYTGVAHLGQNPINDANDMASTLRSLGFQVILKIDANREQMTSAIRDFGKINKDAQVAMFFFAGHGMQVNRANYLVPLGVNLDNQDDVRFECISVEVVQRVMEHSNADRLNLIVLDACRNNPFRSWERGGQGGLADMTPPSGTLIAFATSPGSTAANGTGRNGLYTGELIKQLSKPQRIEDVFINTRIEVEKISGGKQSPWELARLRGKYSLVK